MMTEKYEYNNDIAIVCKEKCYYGSEVYFTGWLIKDNLKINLLKLRMRYNPELEYYAMIDKTYKSEIEREYVINLIKNGIRSNLYTYI